MTRIKWRSLLGGAAVALLGLVSGPAVAQFFTNGLPPAGGVQYPNTIPLTGVETIPTDTNLGSGINPASEAVTVFQLAGYFQPPVALTNVANGIVINARLSSLFTLTLTGDYSLKNPSNLYPGQVFRVAVTQDSTGNRTLAYDTLYKWTAGSAPTVSPASNGTISLLTFVYNGSVLLGTSLLDLR